LHSPKPAPTNSTPLPPFTISEPAPTNISALKINIPLDHVSIPAEEERSPKDRKVLLRDCVLNEFPFDAIQKSTVSSINNLLGAAGESPKDLKEFDGKKGMPVEIVDSGSRIDDPDYAYKIANGRAHEVVFSKDGDINFLKVRLLDDEEDEKFGWVPQDHVGESPTNKYKFSMGSISYISINGLPLLSDFPGVNVLNLGISWPARVIVGLLATINPSPPTEITNISDFIQTKQFRAVMWSEVTVEVDEVRDKVLESSISSAIVDPGYTPPVNLNILPPDAATAFEFADWLFNDKEFHAGDLGSGSRFFSKRRHPNSAMPISSEETVIGEGLIRFRAGEDTDALGVNKALSPFHVPWVWCGLAVTYAGDGKFRFHTQGSVFPTHYWYVEGKLISISQQKKVEIDKDEIAIATGAPVEPNNQPQVDKNAAINNPVDKVEFTIPAAEYYSTVIEIEAEPSRLRNK
jgi:hypothetical protein